jgi:hypothetical protein
MVLDAGSADAKHVRQECCDLGTQDHDTAMRQADPRGQPQVVFGGDFGSRVWKIRQQTATKAQIYNNAA